MTAAIPRARPQMTLAEVRAAVEARHGAATSQALGWGDTPIIVAIRGYYRDTMGQPGRNDRAIYDDAVLAIGGGTMAAFNANTDPSAVRKGRGTAAGKGMARLKPGIYHAHQFGKHKGQYGALIQTGGPVTVIRDGLDGDYEETGFFGINIHRGGVNTTSSEGCITIPTAQYPEFIATMTRIAKAMFGASFRTGRVTLVLLDGVA